MQHKKSLSVADGAKLRKIFAKNMERLLTRKGYSVANMATCLGVHHQTVSRWKLGKNLPTRYMERICAYLHTDLHELFQADAKNKHPPLPGTEDMIKVAVPQV